MNNKQMKLNELKALVRAWKKTKSVRTATDISDFLANNLDLDDEDINAPSMHDHHGWARKDGNEA